MKKYKVWMHVEEISIVNGEDEYCDMDEEILPIPLGIFTEEEFKSGDVEKFMTNLSNAYYFVDE